MTSTDNLADLTWDGLDLVQDDPTGLTAVVTNVDGWYSTPDTETNDVARVLTDGSLYGPKVTASRQIIIEGTVVCTDRQRLIAMRDDLASRALATVPAALSVEDPWLGQVLTAAVRASAAMTHSWIGRIAFRYQITLVAADPRRYSSSWSTVVIALSGAGGSGRTYPRTYQWHYASTNVAGSVLLYNPGNMPAPVVALYTGPLSESYLSDGTNQIHLAAVDVGVQLYVATDTLLAQAPGGATRASYILAGSSPLIIPPRSTVRWSLAATGTGTVLLSWRGAFA